jgi:hypothetical protein
MHTGQHISCSRLHGRSVERGLGKTKKQAMCSRRSAREPASYNCPHPVQIQRHCTVKSNTILQIHATVKSGWLGQVLENMAVRMQGFDEGGGSTKQAKRAAEADEDEMDKSSAGHDDLRVAWIVGSTRLPPAARHRILQMSPPSPALNIKTEHIEMKAEVANISDIVPARM